LKKIAIISIFAVIAAFIFVYFFLAPKAGPRFRSPATKITTEDPASIGKIIPPDKVNHTNETEKKNPIDKAEMIKVPAGEFFMGALKDDKSASTDEKPGGKVYLDTFYIYRNEVTIAQFERFIADTGYVTGDDWKILLKPDKPDKNGVDQYISGHRKGRSRGYNPNMPVVNVTWEDAVAYCRWANVTLPTEAQWEKASRRKDMIIYPWGDKPAASYLNCLDNKNVPKDQVFILKDGRGPVQIGLFQAGGSRFGVNDMGGNVAEWVSDFYSPGHSPGEFQKNPTGPSKGTFRVVKGGSWDSKITDCRVSARKGMDPKNHFITVGFRCARPKKSTGAQDVHGGKLREPPKYKKNKKDGALMILIPGGEFTMGAEKSGKDSDSDEKPKKKVSLKPFYIYKYEVTNAQFNIFIQEAGYKPDGEWHLLYNNFSSSHPVTEISYRDAVAYTKWAGGRLPTEAEWEKAARGNDGRRYPWGDRWNPELCNGREMKKKRKDVAKLEKQGGIWYGTLPVGSFPGGESPYGVMDMAGNVSEWCIDWYDEDYYGKAPSKNPTGPRKGEERVLRGGSFYDKSNQMRCASRDEDDPDKWCNLYGFRVVIPLEKE